MRVARPRVRQALAMASAVALAKGQRTALACLGGAVGGPGVSAVRPGLGFHMPVLPLRLGPVEGPSVLYPGLWHCCPGFQSYRVPTLCVL